MLAKKRYARHALQGKTIPFLFLSLVLLFSLFSNIATANNVSPSYKEDDFTNFTFSANTKIPIPETRYLDISQLFKPDLEIEWRLYTPNGEVAYFEEPKIHEKKDIFGGVVVYLKAPDIYVPAFPAKGRWRVELAEKRTGLVGYKCIFNVGESSFIDNIMAPIYVSWGGIPYVGWGEFSWSLPGIFWLTSPFWGFAIFFIALALYARSFRAATGLIKESGKRFREAWME